MKTAPFLKFLRQKDGTYEALIYPFNDQCEGMYALIARDEVRRSGWVVCIVQDAQCDSYPIFAGTFMQAKQFVRLMWESLR